MENENSVSDTPSSTCTSGSISNTTKRQPLLGFVKAFYCSHDFQIEIEINLKPMIPALLANEGSSI